MSEIDRFQVKPSGFLAKWRSASVAIDAQGDITNPEVPGEPVMNLDRISDYKSNNRRYNPGDKITEFCNLSTFTNYRVYATDERPFARVETDINAAKCGYQTPLPEPSVPFSPFGDPEYGTYRTYDFCDIEGKHTVVSIEKKNYTGEVGILRMGGKSPVIFSYKEVDDKFAPFRPLECKLSFISDENFLLQEFYTSDERAFRVSVVTEGMLQFRGYIIPGSCREPFSAPPYEVTISATDALGGLKSSTYPVPVGSNVEVYQSFVGILAYCFSLTNLNLDIKTVCNLYDTYMPTGLDNDPLSMAKVNPLRLVDDKGATLSCYAVLEAVATAWGAYIVQANGMWNFVRANEMSNDVIRSRNYNYKGLFLRGENLQVNRVIGSVLNKGNDIL